MKLRFSNRRDLDFQFEANDVDSFRENAMSALRSLRIAEERRVHRGEIRKTVSRFGHGELGVYDEHNGQWYCLEGEPGFADTVSFGRIAINRQFRLEVPVLETDTLADALTNDQLNLICTDPLTFEHVHLMTDAARIWNLCVGAYQHAAAVNGFMNGFADDFEKLTGNPEHD